MDKSVKIDYVHWEKLRKIAFDKKQYINRVLFDILEEYFSERDN